MADHEYHQQPEDDVQEVDEVWYRDLSLITAMLSNFSTSYNAVNVSLALPILAVPHPNPEPTAVSAVASSLLAGMMVGQLMGGALGDLVGVRRALLAVMVLQVMASFGSALFCRESFWELSLYRFILGIGAGGVYPLAAVLSSGKNKSLHKVVLTFSMQGLGFISVPVVALLLLYTTTNLSLIWRILLGVGGVPGIILLGLNSRCNYRSSAALDNEASHLPMEEQDHEAPESSADSLTETTGLTSDDEEPCPDPPVTAKSGIWESIKHEENLVRKMLGTAATWFLFDILFYGNTLFQPIVIEAAFGTKDHTDPMQLLLRTAQDSLILASIALPGYAAAGILLGKKNSCCYCGIKQTTRFVMLQGFAVMAILYLVIGVAWNDLEGSPTLLLLLYGLTFFFANYGPNTTTFVLPSLVYSPDCRSTLNGICAAAGKFGALAGASMFGPLASSIGDSNIMLLCAGVSVIAWSLTRVFVPVEVEGPNGETYEATSVEESSVAPVHNAEPA